MLEVWHKNPREQDPLHAVMNPSKPLSNAACVISLYIGKPTDSLVSVDLACN